MVRIGELNPQIFATKRHHNSQKQTTQLPFRFLWPPIGVRAGHPCDPCNPWLKGIEWQELTADGADGLRITEMQAGSLRYFAFSLSRFSVFSPFRSSAFSLFRSSAAVASSACALVR